MLDHEGRPLAQVFLSLISATHPRQHFQTYTKLDGRFLFETASPGEFMLLLEKEGMDTLQQQAKISQSIESLEFRLKPASEDVEQILKRHLRWN